MGYEFQPRGTVQDLPILTEAIRNCVVEFAKVAKGEKVLVLYEFTSDPLVPEMLAAASVAEGADVALMQMKPLSPGGYEPDTPSDVVLGAYSAADVVFSCNRFALAHTNRLFFTEITKHKAKLIEMPMLATVPAMASGGRFPIPLFMKIVEVVERSSRDCKRVKVTDPKGTDLVFESPRFGGNAFDPRPGTWSIFPVGGFNWYPDVSHGKFSLDESTLTGKSAGEIVITVEKGLVTNVQGRIPEVKAIEAFANGQYYMRHAHIGLNPKVRFEGTPQFEREKHAGVFYLGIDGTGSEGKIDRQAPGYSHLDCIIDNPTVYFDDRLIVKDRHLVALDDPEVREFAKKYGDPDRVLAQNHLVW